MSSQTPPRQRSRFTVPIIIIAVTIVMIVALLILQLSRSSSPDPSDADTPATNGSGTQSAPATNSADPTEGNDQQSTEQPDFTVFETRDENDPLSYGSVDAPVALVVFSDYQCGYCSKWSRDTLPEMMALADQGLLYIEWRDLNIFGDDSERASRASYAAALQGKFWEYHDSLFPDGGTLAGGLSEDALVALAAQHGLDTDLFLTDMNSEETAAAVAQNANLGLSLGASSTPTFLLGGTPIVGAQPTEVFMQVFSQAQATARG